MKNLLTDYDVVTVTDAGFSGLKNGKLLKLASELGFNILLTIDKNIDYQQSIEKFSIALVILEVQRSHINYIKPLLPIFNARANSFKPGLAYWINSDQIQ